MAPLSFSASSRTRSFICDSCLTSLRSLRRAPPTVPQSFTIASSASYAIEPAKRPQYTPSRKYTRRTCQSMLGFHRRSYTTSVSSEPLPRPVNRGCAHLTHRRLISLSGADAAKFLQGLITNNVDPSRHAPFYSAFLDARGRVLWDVFVWVYPELAGKEWACYIEVDAGEADAMMKHLKRHKLRSRIKISAVEEHELGVYAAWGLAQEELPGDQLVASLEDPRGPGFGIRCLVKGDGGWDIPAVDLLQYRLRRYLYGIPEGPDEIPRESALPMECNVDLSNGIDFRKGCYVGQELTIRTKHTGVVRKRILPVQLYRGQTLETDSAHQSAKAATFFLDPTWDVPPPDSGADIKQLDEHGAVKKGRAAGKFIAGIGNIGLALCRLEMMTSMKISAEGGSWKPGMEFGVQRSEGAEGEEPVRVRAIVPQWFRERERDMWDKARTRV